MKSSRLIKFLIIILLLLIALTIVFNKQNKKTNPVVVDENTEDIEACGFKLLTPGIGEIVSNTFKVEAIVDNSKRDELGCGWTVFEGQAGLVHVYDKRGFSVGSALLKTTSDWMTSGPVVFTATINIDVELEDEFLVMLIEEDDPAGFGDSDIIEVSLVYKN